MCLLELMRWTLCARAAVMMRLQAPRALLFSKIPRQSGVIHWSQEWMEVAITAMDSSPKNKLSRLFLFGLWNL